MHCNTNHLSQPVSHSDALGPFCGNPRHVLGSPTPQNGPRMFVPRVAFNFKEPLSPLLYMFQELTLDSAPAIISYQSISYDRPTTARMNGCISTDNLVKVDLRNS